MNLLGVNTVLDFLQNKVVRANYSPADVKSLITTRDAAQEVKHQFVLLWWNVFPTCLSFSIRSDSNSFSFSTTADELSIFCKQKFAVSAKGNVNGIDKLHSIKTCLCFSVTSDSSVEQKERT